MNSGFACSLLKRIFDLRKQEEDPGEQNGEGDDGDGVLTFKQVCINSMFSMD